ncbi:hypothetical protein LXL04_023952 [Taraxacum kok-saghyz]
MLVNWEKQQSMNTSPFMDKQIMDLSSSQNKNNAEKDFMDLNNQPPQEDEQHDVVVGDDDKKDEILPSYDFQPIRPITSSQPSNFESSSGSGARVWASAESKPNFGTRNYGSLDSVEPPKVTMEKDRSVIDAALISEIDRTMKKHADNLMYALEGVSARISQLESRSRNLENSVDDLRTYFGNSHGNTDGKLRQIENIIREVQAGIEVVKDKQEIMETQLQLSQVKFSKPEQPPEPHISGHMGSLQQQAALPSPPLPNPQNLGPPIHHPPQFPANIMPIPQHDSYYPPPGQTAEPPPPPPPQQQQYQMPPPPKLSPPSPSPQPQYQYPQPPPMSLQHPEEPPYLPYPPSFRQPGGGPPPQFHGNPSGPGFSGQYEPYNYGGGSPVKSQQQSNMGPGGGSGFSQLPTARILPQSLPTAAAVGGGGGGGGSGSGSGGNRVPIDDVVDKVTSMGFPREQVRATVRKLTENGQAVDLNVVLDKLMTDGVESQGPRAWFGR